MKIIIVANSPKKSFKEMYHLNPSDYFIGLDGGAMELLERRIKPDIAIGDFDSTNFLQEIEKNAIVLSVSLYLRLKLKFFQPKKMRLI